MLGHFGAWLALFFEPDLAVLLWYKAGSPAWLTLIYLCLFTFSTSILMFWGIGGLRGLIKKVGFIHKMAQGTLLKTKNFLPFYKRAESSHKLVLGKTVNWLKRQRAVMIFAASCVPVIPILPTAVIITAKLLEIKHGLILILVGITIRNALLVIGIYHSVSFFFPLN